MFANHPYMPRTWLILLLLLLAPMVFVFTSCEVLKTKRNLKTDSLAVSRVDSTRVTKSDAGTRNDSTWWREVINLFPRTQSGDTVINNTTVPVYNYYPAQIIREGGSISKEDWLRMTDSVNKVKADSTRVNKVEETKSKETKVLGVGQIIAIALGAAVFVTLLSKLKIGIR